MRHRAFIFLIILPCANVFAGEVSKSECSCDFIYTEKDIKKSYQKLRSISQSCNVKPVNYLDLSQRAYLAEHYSVAIWSGREGIASSEKNSRIYQELNYFLGISLLAKERREEAIAILKEIVFNPNWEKTDVTQVQKAHLALINAYSRSEQKNDQNIKYLIRLFKNRYSTSDYLFTLRSWNATREP